MHAVTPVSVPVTSNPERLAPGVAIWADLAPLTAHGVPTVVFRDGTRPVLLATSAHTDTVAPETSRLVLVEPAEPGTDGPGTPSGVHGTQWVLDVPTTWLGLCASMATTTHEIALYLLPGPPPVNAASMIMTTDQAGLLLDVSAESIGDALAASLAPAWAAHSEGHKDPDADIRDLFWVHVAALALGDATALAALRDVGDWLAICDADQRRATGPTTDSTVSAPTTSGAPDNPADQVDQVDDGGGGTDSLTFLSNGAFFDRAPLYEFEHLANRALFNSAIPFDNATTIDHLPRPLATLIETVHVDTVQAAMNTWTELSLSFEDACANVGYADAVIALALTLARRAWTVAGPDGNVAYLLALWFDEDAETPSWAPAATAPYLLAHDTDVLNAVLTGGARGADQPHGDLALQFLNLLAHAVRDLEASPEQIRSLIESADVRPVNLADVVHVATTLAEDTDNDNECDSCDAAVRLIATTHNQDRLLRAATALVAVLADLDADLQGAEIGEPDWVDCRRLYLADWLSHLTDA